MNKKIAISMATVALIAGSFVALGKNPVEAGTKRQGMSEEGVGATREGSARFGMQSKASLLGITVEELTEKMQTMTFSEILEKAGISLEEFHTKKTAEVTSRWKERGLTDEEIQSRLEQLETRRESCDGTNKFQGSPFGKELNK